MNLIIDDKEIKELYVIAIANTKHISTYNDIAYEYQHLGYGYCAGGFDDSFHWYEDKLRELPIAELYTLYHTDFQIL